MLIEQAHGFEILEWDVFLHIEMAPNFYVLLCIFFERNGISGISPVLFVKFYCVAT